MPLHPQSHESSGARFTPFPSHAVPIINAVFAAAALAHYAAGEATDVLRVAGVIGRLVDIDETLIRYAHEEYQSGIDHTELSGKLFDEAKMLLATLGDSFELHYNDDVPDDGGRLRLVIPGPHWDADNPLYFASELQ